MANALPEVLRQSKQWQRACVVLAFWTPELGCVIERFRLCDLRLPGLVTYSGHRLALDGNLHATTETRSRRHDDEDEVLRTAQVMKKEGVKVEELGC